MRQFGGNLFPPLCGPIGAKKAVKTVTDVERWNLLRCRATEVRHMPSKRSHTVIISDRGTQLASKTDTLKRGKVVDTQFVFYVKD